MSLSNSETTYPETPWNIACIQRLKLFTSRLRIFFRRINFPSKNFPKQPLNIVRTQRFDFFRQDCDFFERNLFPANYPWTTLPLNQLLSSPSTSPVTHSLRSVIFLLHLRSRPASARSLTQDRDTQPSLLQIALAVVETAIKISSVTFIAFPPARVHTTTRRLPPLRQGLFTPKSRWQRVFLHLFTAIAMSDVIFLAFLWKRSFCSSGRKWRMGTSTLIVPSLPYGTRKNRRINGNDMMDRTELAFEVTGIRRSWRYHHIVNHPERWISFITTTDHRVTVINSRRVER